MVGALSSSEEAQLLQTIEMFEVITQSQPQDYQSLEILKEAYQKLGRDTDVVSASKRIAQAYVLMGQLSSAILEYESILQRFPDDPDVLAALSEIESKANSLAGPAAEVAEPVKAVAPTSKLGGPRKSASDMDDGRQAMHKIFVEGKVIHQGDFDLCWVQHDLNKPVTKVIEPFIQVLADKGVVSIEKSLHILSDKTRLGYLPLDKYDIDTELARKFPALVCQRWCVVPFDCMSKSIIVATANPFNRQAALELEASSNRRLLWYLSNPTDLTKVIKKVFR